jgi:hypothetical protein
VYLTYIIENYDTLRDITVFLHAHWRGEFAWHNDAPGKDNAAALRLLRLDHVLAQGYVNLRCRTDIGCPDVVQPFRDPPNANALIEHNMADAWLAMFGDAVPVPRVIGVPCCSQFAVSRAQIHAREKREYERVHAWLMGTELDDQLSGRVLEYLWHIIFGKEAQQYEDFSFFFSLIFLFCYLPFPLFQLF